MSQYGRMDVSDTGDTGDTGDVEAPPLASRSTPRHAPRLLMVRDDDEIIFLYWKIPLRNIQLLLIWGVLITLSIIAHNLGTIATNLGKIATNLAMIADNH